MSRAIGVELTEAGRGGRAAGCHIVAIDDTDVTAGLGAPMCHECASDAGAHDCRVASLIALERRIYADQAVLDRPERRPCAELRRSAQATAG